MNYLWEVLMAAEEQKVAATELYFTMAKRYSGFMELSQRELNNTLIDKNKAVEINPYYRFYEIFKDLFPMNEISYPQLRKELFNLLFHFLGESDRKLGMSTEEYYKRMLWQELLSGAFGREVSAVARGFQGDEKEMLLSGILRLYQTGSSVELFREMMAVFVPKGILYASKANPFQLFIYVENSWSRRLAERILLLIRLFVGLHYQVELFYEYHFGILGLDETMVIDEIAIY